MFRTSRLITNTTKFNATLFQGKRAYASLYTKSHEYIKTGSGNVVVGISDHAQKELGDVIHLETFVKEGDKKKKGETIAEVESVKSVSEIYSPISGTVKKVNTQLKDTPSLLNESAEDKGWIIEMEAEDLDSESKELLDSDAYKKYSEEEH
ncbi:glycine cleavage system H protein [Acrasis kona]|uniref:Glycine cleavage system H protein n=1 Tax=Acrasis kona TaxID=1008807 RepID=A0AAW2ZE46_9EUKA